MPNSLHSKNNAVESKGFNGDCGVEKKGAPKTPGYPDKLLKNNALKIDIGGYPDKLMKKQEIQVFWGSAGHTRSGRKTVTRARASFSTLPSPASAPSTFFRSPGRGLAQTAAFCSLRSRRDMYVEIIWIGITNNADTETRVCASPDFSTRSFRWFLASARPRALR